MDLATLVRLRAGVAEPQGTAALDDLLAREAVRDLVALYAMAVDVHDEDALALMFAPTARLDLDGSVADGRDAVLAALRASMTGFRRMVHTPETHVVHVSGGSGRGVATAHAELVTRSGVVVAAHEYEDTYAVRDDRWVFESRKIRFVYAVRASEYAQTLPREDRVRLPGQQPRTMTGTWFATADSEA